MATKSVVYTYIEAQTSTPYKLEAAATSGLSALQKKISNVLYINEIGGDKTLISPYVLYHHRGVLSSFSFGATQWDIDAYEPLDPSKTNIKKDDGTELDSAYDMLLYILKRAKNSSGNQIISDKKYDEIADQLKNGNGKNKPHALGDLVPKKVKWSTRSGH